MASNDKVTRWDALKTKFRWEGVVNLLNVLVKVLMLVMDHFTWSDSRKHQAVRLFLKRIEKEWKTAQYLSKNRNTAIFFNIAFFFILTQRLFPSQIKWNFLLFKQNNNLAEHYTLPTQKSDRKGNKKYFNIQTIFYPHIHKRAKKAKQDILA